MDSTLSSWHSSTLKTKKTFGKQTLNDHNPKRKYLRKTKSKPTNYFAQRNLLLKSYPKINKLLYCLKRVKGSGFWGYDDLRSPDQGAAITVLQSIMSVWKPQIQLNTNADKITQLMKKSSHFIHQNGQSFCTYLLSWILMSM